MIKGPLVYAAVALAAILLVLSFAIVALPEYIEILGIVAGAAAICVVAVLVMMLIKTRKAL